MSQIKCGGCSSITEKYSSVTASELYDIPKSRGSANLVQKVGVDGILLVPLESPIPLWKGKLNSSLAKFLHFMCCFLSACISSCTKGLCFTL
jgi:hypothetical protein